MNREQRRLEQRRKRGGRLPRAIMLAIALVQINGSNAILTGGSVPIVAAALIGGMSWGKWFLYMALPSYAILFLLGLVIFLIYRPLRLPAPGSDGEVVVGSVGLEVVG